MTVEDGVEKLIRLARGLLPAEEADAGVAAVPAVAPDGLPDPEAAAEAVDEVSGRVELLRRDGDLDFRRVCDLDRSWPAAPGSGWF